MLSAKRKLLLHHPFTLIAVSYDFVVAAVIWSVGMMLRFSVEEWNPSLTHLFWTTAVAVSVEMLCFIRLGLYRGIWRYASLHDVKQIVQAVAISALIVPTLLVLWNHAALIPRILFVINPLLLILFMGGGRILYRWWKEHRPYKKRYRTNSRPLLLLGAGETALKIVKNLRHSPSWYVVGLLDDDPHKIGHELSGVPVIATWQDLAAAADATGAQHAILAIADSNSAVRRRAFKLCEENGVELLLVPGVEDVISGKVRISKLRHVEVDDLLGRDPVELNTLGLKQWISGKVVLVTGAGGSIGSELCWQLARFEPRQLVLLDNSEFSLYSIHERLRTVFEHIELTPMIGDVRQPNRLDQVFAVHRPSLVFHAAAYKHVPMMETANATQAVLNNVMGTLNVAQACVNYEVDRFVFVSTDKAVNPTSVMGASKRLAEMLLQHLNFRDQLPVVIVRFGNVLGSTGSVIPKFREQIMRGGPITVTHPEMTRYFMSIREAAQLVLQAGMMGQTGEVFVLEMGDPVKIVDLARDMIRLSGLTEDEMQIVYTGLRPGEKLFEELLANDETTIPTPFSKLRVQRPMAPPGATWFRKMQDWISTVDTLSDEEVRGGLIRFIPEYRPAPGLSSSAVSDAADESLLLNTDPRPGGPRLK